MKGLIGPKKPLECTLNGLRSQCKDVRQRVMRADYTLKGPLTTKQKRDRRQVKSRSKDERPIHWTKQKMMNTRNSEKLNKTDMLFK